MTAWRVFRIGAVVLAGLSAAIVPLQPHLQINISWLGVVLSSMLIPSLFLVATLILIAIRGNRLNVQALKWSQNPFDFSHPEHFWHLGAFVMLVSGVVTLTRSFLHHGQVFPGTALPIALSLGLLALLHILAGVSRRAIRE